MTGLHHCGPRPSKGQGVLLAKRLIPAHRWAGALLCQSWYFSTGYDNTTPILSSALIEARYIVRQSPFPSSSYAAAQLCLPSSLCCPSCWGLLRRKGGLREPPRGPHPSPCRFPHPHWLGEGKQPAHRVRCLFGSCMGCGVGGLGGGGSPPQIIRLP